MRRYVEETIKRQKLEDVLCNKCGGSCKSRDEFFVYHGHAYGRYGSPHLRDGEDYDFDLCEACLLDLFKTFKIPVETD